MWDRKVYKMIHKTLNKHVDAGNWLPEKPLNILERHEGENNLVPLWKILSWWRETIKYAEWGY